MKNILEYEEFLNEAIIKNDTKKYYVTIDIIAGVKNDKLIPDPDGETHPDFFKIIKNLDYKIIKAEGPGGGWPEVKFKGTKSQLLPLLKLIAADDTIDIEKELEKWDGSEDGLIDIIG